MITARMQKRWLHDRFIKEDDFEINPKDLTAPWREIYLLTESTHGIVRGGSDLMLRDACIAVAADEEEGLDIFKEIQQADKPLTFKTLDEIAATLPPVRWVWQDWLPRGMLSLLGAYQGTGKSYFVLDLARAVIAGDQWPDGTPVQTPGSCIYVDAEAIPMVHNERAEALGLRKDRLYLVMADNGQLLDLTERRWQDHLVDMVTTVRPELIIIDSLSSISTAGQNSVDEINRLLMFLVALARYGDCSVLVLHHLRKPPNGQLALPGLSIHDFRGSGHITAMARTVLGLSVVQTGRQFSLNGARRLDLAKTNLGPYPDSLGIELQQDGDRVQFVYGEAPDYESSTSTVDECEDWLLDYLTDNGPSRPSVVVEAAEAEGFNRRMIYRARQRLGDDVVNTEGRQHPNNRWALPHQVDEEEEQDEEL